MLRPERTGFWDIFFEPLGARLVRVKWGLPYLAVSNSGFVATQYAGHHWTPAFSQLRGDGKKTGTSTENHGDSRRRTPSPRLRTNSRKWENSARENGEHDTAYQVKSQSPATPQDSNNCIDTVDRNAKAQSIIFPSIYQIYGARIDKAAPNLEAMPLTIAWQECFASPVI